MCYLTAQQITQVLNEVEEKVNNNEAFTSVDISNALRKKGVFLPHHEVSDCVRQDALSFTGLSWTRCLISVNLKSGQTVWTYLYYDADEMKPEDYTNRSQTLIRNDVNATPKNVRAPRFKVSRRNPSWDNCYKQKRDPSGKFLPGKISRV